MFRCTRSHIVFLLCLLGMCLWNLDQVHAQIVNAGAFRVEFWDQADGDHNWGGETVAAADLGTWNAAQRAAVIRGFEYWTEQLGLPATPGPNAPIIRVLIDTTIAGDNANANSTGITTATPSMGGAMLGKTNTIARLAEGTNPGRVDGLDGRIHFSTAAANAGTDRITQLMNAEGALERVTIHEIGHLLGLTDGIGESTDGTTVNEIFANQLNGADQFTGTNAVTMFGGNVPFDADRAHFNLDYHNVTRANPFGNSFRNIAPIGPVELGVLADLGFGGINLANEFGTVIYQDGTNTLQTLNTPFTTAEDYAIGVFLQAEDRNLNITGDMNLSGFAATGVRIAGAETDTAGNLITIGPGTTLDVNGVNGVGILASSGADNVIVHRGTINANGTDGVGMLFDFGFFKSAARQVDSGDYNNYLIRRIDITGEISAENGAGNVIEIANTAAIQEINIMAGAMLDGHIESNAFTNGSLDAPTITFGRTPDANGQAMGTGDAGFNFTYNGNIFGTTDPDLDFFGGSSLFNGNLELNNVLIQAGTTTFSNTSVINAQDVTQQNGNLVVNGQFDIDEAEIQNGTATFGAASVVNAFDVTVQNGNFVVNSNDFDTLFFTMQDGLTDVNGNLDAFVSADILGGEANVNGTFIAGAFNLGQLGILSGEGVVQSGTAFQGAGTIAPGNSIGTITIMGDYDGLPTANYDIELDPAGQVPGVHSDLIDVTGVATIDAGTVNVIDLPGTFAVASQYVFLQGAPLMVVNPVVVNEFIVDRRIIQAIGPTQYSLLMARDVDYGTLGETSNQIRFGNYLEAVELDPDVQGLRDLLDLIPLDDDVRFAFDQLGGEVYASHLTSRLNSDSIFMDIVGGVTHNVTDPCATFEYAELQAGAWNVSYGMTGHDDGDGNAHLMDSDFAGTALGYSELLSDNAFAGFVYGYEHLETSVPSLRSEVESEVHRFGLFSEYRDGAGFVRGMIVGGYADSNSHRTIVIVNPFAIAALTPDASFDGWLASADLEAGRCVPMGASTIQPIVGLRYLWVGQEEFNERDGNVANLAVDDADVDALRSRLGARFYCPVMNTGTRFSLDTFWQYDLLGEPQGRTTSHLVVTDGADFVIAGVGAGRNRFIISPGIEHTSGALKVFARYRAELSDQFNRHGGEGGLEVGW